MRKLMMAAGASRCALAAGMISTALLNACGGGGGSSAPVAPPPPAAYSVGGTISGLAGSVVLNDNGGDALSVSANGTFAFATTLNAGASYAVTVATQPAGQTCSLANASGTIAAANVSNVTVSCANNPTLTVVPRRLAVTPGFALALKADGTVLSWGTGMAGGAGSPVTGTAATLVTGATSIAAVSAYSDGMNLNGNLSLAIQGDGTVLGWGKTNTAGMGLGAFTQTVSPTFAFQTPTAIAQLGPSVETRILWGGVSLARHADGSLWILGGTADLLGHTVAATQVQGVAGIASLGTSISFASVSLVAQSWTPIVDSNGAASMLVIDGVGDGTGSTTLTASYSVTPIAGLPAVSQVACGGAAATAYHCLALAVDGTVWSWGPDNLNGELGDGTIVGKTVPAQIAGLSGIALIAAAANSSFAVTQSGAVYSWGGYAFDELGRPASADSLTPALVPGVQNVVEIATSANANAAIVGTNVLVRSADGTVWGWGFNLNGELGTGATGAAISPVQASGINLN